MTANPQIGEVPLTLTMANGNQVPFVLKPTPGATVEIEETTGRPIGHLWFASANAGLTVAQLAQIVFSGVKAAGMARHDRLEVSADKLRDPIFYTGILIVSEAVGKFLDVCCNAGLPRELRQKKETGETATLSIGGNGSESPSANSDGASASSGTAAGLPSAPPYSG